MTERNETAQPAPLGQVERGVGRPVPERAFVGELTAMLDPVADALDDMAALGLHWTRNRERGRMPGGIRAAMILVARELLAHEDLQAREMQRRFAEMCGPEAFARNNGGAQ